MKLTLETLTVRGTPEALGRAQGEALRARIESFVHMRQAAVEQYARDRGAAGIGGLMDIGRAAMDIYAGWDPVGFAEHKGIAEGAGIDTVLLYTLTNMTDLRDALLLGGPPPPGWTPPAKPGVENGAPVAVPAAEAEGCSSLLVPGRETADGMALAGQTWDLNPPDVEFVVAIHRQPTDGSPATFGVTCVGCLSLVGLNDRGLAVGTTNIKTWNARAGVGYLSLIHRALRCPDVKAATAAIQGAPRAGAHTYWMADPNRQAELECGPIDAFLRDTSAGAVWRTNHCIAPDLVAAQGEAPSESSQRRFERMGDLLRAAPVTVPGLQGLFADRADGLHSINRYAEDGQGTATNSVFIANPAERRAWACRGSADRGQWVEFSFT